MKLIKRKNSKRCTVCNRIFIKRKNISLKKWETINRCSVKCKHLYITTEKYKEERLQHILSKTITTSTGCMEWKGSTNHKGYGLVRFQSIYKSTHRVVWELIKGKIPNGLFVLHKCDNPPCLNINHLFLGTSQDNVNDMVNKNRHNHKLNTIQIQEILTKTTEGISYNKIGILYNITRRHACKIAQQNGIHRR